MAILHTDTRNIQRMGVANEHAFTIKASSKAFQILSGALYSDKPLAIVRELCTNAYDSHVAAGKKDTPFELILPSRLNPTLTVKDFGLGLDHNGVLNVYTKFFESTKTESNDFVGQLGLGSKAPFSMFKTFNVEARKDGVKRIYTAYTNEDGIPTIAQMGETATDEPNGLTVSMTVKADDFDKFHNAAKRALMYFDPKPLVNGVEGFATYQVKHGVGGSNWKLRESDYWARMSGPYVVQGFVVYPIDGALIKDHGLSDAAKVVAGLNIDFWMDIGSVDVAPSREALSYDKRTIANIAAAFEAVAAELRQVIQAEFDACKTAYEAGCLMHKYQHEGNYEMRQLFNNLHTATPFTWKGKDVTYKYSINTQKIRSTIIMRATNSGRKLSYDSRYEPTTADVKREVMLAGHNALVVDDLHRGSGDILRQFMNANRNLSSVVVLRATKKADHDEKEIKRIVKMLGDAPVQRISELPFKPTVARGVKGRGKEQRLKFTGFKKRSTRWGYELNRTFSRLTWEAVDVDLSKGGFYLPIERFAVIHNGRVVECLDEIIASAKSLGLITTDEAESIYGFNEKEAAKAGKNWVNFFDYVTKQFAKLKVEDTVAKANALSHLSQQLDSFDRYVVQRWTTVEPMLNDGQFKTFINKIRAQAQQLAGSTDTARAANTFLNCMGIKSSVETKTKELANQWTAEWNAVLDAHSMLKIVDWYKIDSTTVHTITDYINTVAAK